MHGCNHLTALLISAALILTGCSSGNGPRRVAETDDCNDTTDLAEAVYRELFANNASSLGSSAAAYFVAGQSGADPSASLLKRFDGHRPPVKAASAAQRTEDRIIDPDTGERALLFRIDRLETVADDEARVEAGYFEGRLSAGWVAYSANCDAGRWTLTRRGPAKIS